MRIAHNDKKSAGRSLTIYIVRIAILAALLTAGKLALSFIPNVEVVTLLVIVYGSALGLGYALPATLVFCAVEMAIYGIGSWNLLYFVYWPLLGAVSSALRGRRLPLAMIIGAVGSALFGVLDASIYCLVIAGNLAPAKLGQYFVAYYLKGVPFDIVHVISSVATVGILYVPLVRALNVAMRSVCLRRRLKTKIAAMTDEYMREPRQ